jgi:glycosyltransferase involved in cell wall biosynthesis
MSRILIVTRSLQMGGIERHTVTLANAFHSLGHAVDIMSFKKRYVIKPDDGVRVHFHDMDRIFRRTVIGGLYILLVNALLSRLVPRSGFFWRSLYWMPLFRHFVHREEKQRGRFDYIFFMAQGGFENLWSFKEDRSCRVIVSPTFEPRGSKLDALFTRMLYNGTNIVAISSGVKQSLESRFDLYHCEPKSLRLITNPIPIDEIQQLSREHDQEVPLEPYIVHVARLTYQKNQKFLIRAYHRAAVKEKLVIVGDGKDRPMLDKLVNELGLEKKVIFVGQKENPFPWMKHAEAFILSSRFEGFGLVLAESMACGTQVVAVDCPGGVRDVLINEQTRLIAEPSVDGLAKKIREALENPVLVKPEWYRRFDSIDIAGRYIELPQSH